MDAVGMDSGSFQASNVLVAKGLGLFGPTLLRVATGDGTVHPFSVGEFNIVVKTQHNGSDLPGLLALDRPRCSGPLQTSRFAIWICEILAEWKSRLVYRPAPTYIQIEGVGTIMQRGGGPFPKGIDQHRESSIH